MTDNVREGPHHRCILQPLKRVLCDATQCICPFGAFNPAASDTVPCSSNACHRLGAYCKAAATWASSQPRDSYRWEGVDEAPPWGVSSHCLNHAFANRPGIPVDAGLWSLVCALLLLMLGSRAEILISISLPFHTATSIDRSLGTAVVHPPTFPINS
eukprot:1157735-Pelagomonas_calceolata.AAC.2